MDRDWNVSCMLCKRREETDTTGALSTKNEVTAHQNCLLYASNLCCRESPQFDDLFGFWVEDVLEEVNRGKKLSCHKCRQKGATAGCEVKRCKKSYHYPCAVEHGAEIIEDPDKEEYRLYCIRHHQNQQNAESSAGADGPNCAEPKPSEHSSGSSEDGSCPACEKTEESICLERSANNVGLYCDKHAPSSSKNVTRSPSKRRPSNKDDETENPPKRKSAARKNRLFDISSSSDEDGLNKEMDIFAPLESDLDENATYVSEHQLNRNETKNPTESTSGNQLKDIKREKSTDKDETYNFVIHSDTVSESLPCPVKVCKEAQTISTNAQPLLETIKRLKTEDKDSSLEQRPDQSPDRCGQSVPQKTLCPSSLSAEALPLKPESSIDSASFWKSCNTAGCTQTIFTDFINKINDISSRIQSDKASQEDYDRALSVMAASGKLEELVAKQQEELKRKQMELTKAVDIMTEVISALKKKSPSG